MDTGENAVPVTGTTTGTAAGPTGSGAGPPTGSGAGSSAGSAAGTGAYRAVVRPTGRLLWQAARLVDLRDETPTARTLVFSVPGWPGHLPGQHVDVRLTAEDGYSTERSYSLASAADGERVELTVQRISGGEVSPYLSQDLAVGDLVEMRGPVGGWFVWPAGSRPHAPVLLVAGGSGVAPLMAMVRSRPAWAPAPGEAAPWEAGPPGPASSGPAEEGSRLPPFRLVYSLRGPDDRLFAAELDRGAPGMETAYVYTRRTPPGWPTPAGRLTAEDLARWGRPPDYRPDVYVCGPTGFVEAAADLLVGLGHAPLRVRTERFGPSGG